MLIQLIFDFFPLDTDDINSKQIVPFEKRTVLFINQTNRATGFKTRILIDKLTIIIISRYHKHAKHKSTRTLRIN